MMKHWPNCVNDDGRPVQRPSKVLCKICMHGITRKMEKILKEMKDESAPKIGEGCSDDGFI